MKRILHGFGYIGKQSNHFCRRFKAMMGGKTIISHAGKPLRVCNTSQHTVRAKHVFCFKMTIICCHKADICCISYLEQDWLGTAFTSKTMALQLNINTVAKHIFQTCQSLKCEVALTMGSRLPDKAAPCAAGQQDQTSRTSR